MHRRRYLEAVLDAASRADHLVVTGDVTNLGLESEYREARRLFDRHARPGDISVIPGNHDLYLPSISREGRFERHFGSFVRAGAAPLRRVLATLTRGLVLFGHLHVRVRCRFGALHVVCASGAALDHPDDSIRAGYNLYELDDRGVVGMEAIVVDAAGGSLRRADVSTRAECL